MNEAGGERGGGVAVTVSGSSRTSAGVAAKTPTSSSRFYPTPQAVPVAPKARKVIGEWTLTKTLGEGSMGKVKLAVNSISGEKARPTTAFSPLFFPRPLF